MMLELIQRRSLADVERDAADSAPLVWSHLASVDVDVEPLAAWPDADRSQLRNLGTPHTERI